MTTTDYACCTSTIGQPCAHKVVGVDSDAKARVLAELASFAHYPPEENSLDGKCMWCDFPVEAHHGLVVLGHDSKGTFAGHLHRGCAAEIRRLQGEWLCPCGRTNARNWTVCTNCGMSSSRARGMLHRECEGCNAESGEACRPMCIGGQA